MELNNFTCSQHNLENEIYCKGCNKIICAQCITNHASDGHKVDYAHIFDYLPKESVEKINLFLSETRTNRVEKVKNMRKTLKDLKIKIPVIKKRIELWEKICLELKRNINLLKILTENHNKGLTNSDELFKRLYKSKVELEKVVNEGEIEAVLSVSIKIKLQHEQLFKKGTDLINLTMKDIKAVEEMKQCNEALKIVKTLWGRCLNLDKDYMYENWTYDRKYASPKMLLQLNDQIFEVTSSGEYIGIIGTKPFEYGKYMFMVIPKGLDCTGKEGFGIITKEKFLEAYNKDKAAPVVYNDMIGLMQGKVAQNIDVVMVDDIKDEVMYCVRVNTIDCDMSIAGPGVYLKATLEPDQQYYPCFSCGCVGHRLKIIPSKDYNELISSEYTIFETKRSDISKLFDDDM